MLFYKMDIEHNINDIEYDLEDGLSISLMSEICKKYSEMRGAEEKTSFNLDDFLHDRFSGTFPHPRLRESIDKLVIDGYLTRDTQNIDLTKKGIVYCRKKTIGFIY